MSTTKLFVSAGTLMQKFADESSWKKHPIPYSLLLLDPSNIKSQNSMESQLVRTPKDLRDFPPHPPNFRDEETKFKEVK